MGPTFGSSSLPSSTIPSGVLSINSVTPLTFNPWPGAANGANPDGIDAQAFVQIRIPDTNSWGRNFGPQLI